MAAARLHVAATITAELRREDFGFRCDNASVQLAALRNGAGIGGHHVHLVRREPELFRVLEQTFKFKREMWLVMHRQSRSTRRIRLVFDHLARSLTAQLNQHGTSRQSVRL